jgi:hypothetical protein
VESKMARLMGLHYAQFLSIKPQPVAEINQY